VLPRSNSRSLVWTNSCAVSSVRRLHRELGKREIGTMSASVKKKIAATQRASGQRFELQNRRRPLPNLRPERP